MSYEIALLVFASLTGLTIRLAALKIGISEPLEQTAMLDESIGGLFVKRSPLQTFLRIFLWNILLSYAIVIVGFLTFGIFPIIWIFLHLGLFCPKISIFKRCLYCWFEASAVILSASLGIWGGLKSNLLLENPGMIPPPFVILILELYAFSALLETLEICQVRDFEFNLRETKPACLHI